MVQRYKNIHLVGKQIVTFLNDTGVLQIFLTALFPHFIYVLFGKHIIFNASILPAMVDKKGHP